MSEILTVENLRAYHLIEETSEMRRAVENVSFTINEGEVFGVTGQSGSGKTTLARTLVGTVTSYPGVINLQLSFDGECIVAKKTEREENATAMNRFTSHTFRRWQRKKYQKSVERLRGRGIFMLLQEPRAALNPYLPIGKQLAECVSSPDVEYEVRRLLASVTLDPTQNLAKFPHELSIGMCQRVGIAMALALKPKLIIADEPTTKLDQVIQKEIVELLSSLKNAEADWRLTMLLITHQLGVINALANRVAVMHEGEFVEVGETQQVFSDPQHPYTEKLIRSYMSIE